MKKIIAAIIGAAVIILGLAGPASAHSADATADCDGVVLKATRYDSNAVNHWSVTISGFTQTGTFGSSYLNTFPVLQGGTTTVWSASIDAPGTQYDFSFSGTVGPCGEVPPPPPVVPPTPPVVPPAPPAPKHAHARSVMTDHCNCYRDFVKVYPGKHASLVKSSHPTKTTWKFTLKADAGFVLPNTIDGNSGWAEVQTYVFHTTNKPCPCKVNHTCHQQYPNYPGPKDPCRAGRPC
jgi:hypothetical protein